MNRIRYEKYNQSYLLTKTKHAFLLITQELSYTVKPLLTDATEQCSPAL